VFINTNTPARGDASANAPAVPSARQEEEEELKGLRMRRAADGGGQIDCVNTGIEAIAYQVTTTSHI
jgi:hypothetical protein